ncbi:MAG TPA: TolC family protein, partial [Longimicrobiales bacterium]|nr:TolC family protein [Longimicrobiales bacterium]
VPLPLFDRQQGSLAAAAADVEVAAREVERLELARRDDLAAALKDYADARSAADRYRNRILPRAEQAADLYRKSFEQMAAAYPQVLIAQRVLQRTRVEYVQALVALWRSATLLDGLLLRGGLDPADGTMGSGGYIPLHPAPLPR